MTSMTGHTTVVEFRAMRSSNGSSQPFVYCHTWNRDRKKEIKMLKNVSSNIPFIRRGKRANEKHIDNANLFIFFPICLSLISRIIEYTANLIPVELCNILVV